LLNTPCVYGERDESYPFGKGLVMAKTAVHVARRFAILLATEGTTTIATATEKLALSVPAHEDCKVPGKKRRPTNGTERNGNGSDTRPKAAKFSRSASARVKRAVKAINLIGSLASPQYEKTPAQVDKIEGYLNAAVRAAVARLRGEAEADNTIEI
jgi:hypothetical protein